MIVVKKKMKKPLIIAILAGVLVVLTVLAIVLNALLDSGAASNGAEEEPIDIIESIGESVYNKTAVAYPHVEQSSMELISIKGEYEYSFIRLEAAADTEKDEAESPFVIAYTDEFGNDTVYAPDIMEEDSNFSYTDVYATTEGDLGSSVAIYKLNYLCTAIGTPYFNGRIPLTPNDYEANQRELAAFGLSIQDDPITIEMYYYDEEGKLEDVTLKIGEKVITGGGYYFTVDSRPYIYSTTNPYFDYVFLSYADYIKPMLIAEGLPQDNAFEPYLTTDFSQWKNTLYDEEGDIVAGDATVIVKADKYDASFDVNKDGDKIYDYNTEEDRSYTFDLMKYKDDPIGKRFYDALMGQAVGTLTSPIAVSHYNFATPVTMGADGKSAEYTYRIKRIDSILTDNGEIYDGSVKIGDNELIKVTYALYLDGDPIAIDDFSGILDLSSSLITDEAKQILRDSTVGHLSTASGHLDINLTYTEDTVKKNQVSLLITEIIEIIDSENETTDKVAEGTTVMFRYYTVINGKVSDKSETRYITLSEELAEDEAAIAEALSGKAVGECEIDIEVYNIDCEIMASYTTYMVEEISYFYTTEKIVSFAFVQASERDVYYGDNFFENTMDGKYSMYALNATACQAVVRLLGGLNESATTSLGLSGTKTVDVGITPEKLKKYGLYSNTIYFELPRGITDLVYEDDGTADDFFSDLADYTYYDTLGFTLYISDEQIDGTRYIASDAYDVISIIDGEDFVFLDESFTDFYARRSIVLTNISAIDKITFDFTMDDVYGTYSNKLIHNELYAYNGKLYHKDQLTEDELEMSTVHDAIEVLVTPSGECMDTAFSQYLDENGYTYGSLHAFYGKETIQFESRGTQNFKEFTEALFFTYYQGNLTEDEIADGLENGIRLMKMTVKLYDGYGAYQYAYEFYRISERRVMVKLYRENIVDGDTKNEVSDFYISTMAFEKLVGLYLEILGGKDISNDTPFVDLDV